MRGNDDTIFADLKVLFGLNALVRAANVSVFIS